MIRLPRIKLLVFSAEPLTFAGPLKYVFYNNTKSLRNRIEQWQNCCKSFAAALPVVSTMGIAELASKNIYFKTEQLFFTTLYINRK